MNWSNHQEFDRVIASFAGKQETRETSPQSPFAIEFSDSLNRLVEHRSICRVMNGESPQSDFWQISPVIRAKDARRVSEGYHLSAFEMLTSLRYATPDRTQETLDILCRWIVEFLVDDLHLDVSRIHVRVFGGGIVIPGVQRPPSIEWENAWVGACIPQKNIIRIAGPSLYLLMYGNGERCGPTCEVLYHPHFASGPVEIGTAIAHDSLVRISGDGAKVDKATVGAYGIAFGLERIAAIASCCKSILNLRPMHEGIERVMDYSIQSRDAKKVLRSEAVSLFDMVRVLCYWAWFENERPAIPPQSFIRRLYRKAAVLQLTDSFALVGALAKDFSNEMSCRHGIEPPNFANDISMWREQMMWQHCWNPDEYLGWIRE
jgi:hypothetical protein